MSAIQTLPSLVHVDIVRHLPLADALAYSQTCVSAHDAVYYVFSHRIELDFFSVLDVTEVITLDDHTLLKVLHAHVRARFISGFCLRADFSSFTELEQYFNMYWSIFTNVHGENVGQPSGLLLEVNLTKPSGIDLDAPPTSRDRLNRLWSSLDMYDNSISSVMVCPTYSNCPLYTNWSTIDLDERRKPCPGCRFPTLSSNEACEQCTLRHTH